MSQPGKPFDLLVIGEINADLILTGEDPVPEFGQREKLLDGAMLAIGSSSVITACGASRLGLRTAFAGVVGDDLFGRFMLDEMARHGIDTAGCAVLDDAATGLTVLLEGPHTGGRAILTVPGAMARFSGAHVDPGLVERARHVHCGGYFLLPALREGLPELFARAGRAGATRSLDTNWDPSGRWAATPELLRECDLLMPNEEELVRLAGAPSVESALDRLAAEVGLVAVKCGPRGGVLRAGDGVWSAAAPAVDVADTTGAGDSFNAGLLQGLLAGASPARQLALAVACGSLSTRALGGTAAQPALEEALALAETLAVSRAN
jgi:sugar/nucleoside kinase (ribokinase family)